MRLNLFDYLEIVWTLLPWYLKSLFILICALLVFSLFSVIMCIRESITDKTKLKKLNGSSVRKKGK